VSYAGCISSIVVAAVLFSLYGRLQVPRNILPKGGMPAVSQIRPRLNSNYAQLPLSFEANQGQADARVKFLSRGRGLTLFLTGNEAVLEVQRSGVRIQDSGAETKGQESGVRSRETGEKLRRSRGPSSLQPTTDHGQRTNPLIQNPKSKIENRVVRLRLVGAKTDAEVIGRDELPGKVNYFIGNDPKKWRTNVPTYGKVRYHNVYPGVDLDYYGNQGGQLEYDFIVAPGADPNAIALDVGAGLVPARGRPQGSPLRIDRDGDLVIPANGSEIRFHKPSVYQLDTGSSLITRHASLVQGRFVLDAKNRVHFALGQYDHARTLVIDPSLIYSTYLGGSVEDLANGVAVDSSGNAYVTGTTYSDDFPTLNPFQATNKSQNGTVFVTEFNATGTALVYSTYLGGSGSDSGAAIAIDSSGNAYITGQTCSSDFPTALPLEAALKGACDGFVAKLNAAGTSLLYSTFLGGSGIGNASEADGCLGIAVDSLGNAYVTGGTVSSDFPTVNALQTSLNGPEDAFVSKLNPTGSALVYSTYLGGSFYDYGKDIGVDSSGNAYVVGSTASSDFPTVNPIQSTGDPYIATFVAKLNSAGSALVYSTYLGGSNVEEVEGIAVDSSGNAYITGATCSGDFPTVNPIQATSHSQHGGASNAYIAKLNPAGSALVYSTYLGGSGVFFGETCPGGGDVAYAIAVDPTGVACVAGTTASSDFPTLNAIQATNNNNTAYGPPAYNAFVTCLNAAGSAWAYSTYLGGSDVAAATGIAVDSSDKAYVVGYNYALDFPTVNPLQATDKVPTGNATGFVAVISPPSSVTFVPPSLNFGGVVVGTSPQQSVVLTPLSNSPVSLTSIIAGGDFALVTTATSCPYGGGVVAAASTCTIDVTFTPSAIGASTGTLSVAYTGPDSPQSIALSGTGGVPAANISPQKLNFQYDYKVGIRPPVPVVLTNTGSESLAVASVTVPDGYTQSNNCLPSVGPKGSCTINVRFQPSAGGPYDGMLTVTDDAINSPQTVQLNGVSFAGPASFSPGSPTFGSVPVGSEDNPQSITLVNPSNGVEGEAPVIGVSGDFSILEDCEWEGYINTGASCDIAVWFEPTAPGTRTGTLTATYTLPAPTTVTASLTGTGEWPGVGLSPASLNFPAQTVSTKSAPQMITLTNTGNAALSPLTITRSGPFAETNNCGGFVAVGASCAISVAFSPINAGSGSGTLTLTDNAGTQSVPLSGSGMDFAVTSSTTTQTVSAGQTAKYSLTFAPQGGFNQTVNLTCTRAPSESTCTLTPSTTTLNGTSSTTVAAAVSTTASSLAPPRGKFLPPGFKGLGGMFWLYALLWLASVAALATARKRRAAWLLGTGLLLVVLWSACGGGSTTPPPSNAGTPAGTYTVDVTATDAAVSTLTHTIQLTLTVN
jgi:hypothetical protein